MLGHNKKYINILKLLLVITVMLTGLAANTRRIRAAYSSLELTVIYTTQIRLSWEDNITDESNYIVERKVDSGDFTAIAALSANSVSYTDYNANAGKVYTYRVSWMDSSGLSHVYTNEVSTTTASVSAPVSLTVTSASSTGIDLAWAYSQSASYITRIERKTAGGNWEVIANVEKGTCTYSDVGLQPNTIYYYRVKAVSGLYVSSLPYPNNDSGYGAYTLLDPPTNLYGYAASSSRIFLYWDDCPYETSYTIERKSPGSEDFSVVGYAPANTVFWSDWGVSPNTRYIYRVKASASYNASSYSEEAVIGSTYIEVPGEFSAEAVSRSEIVLNWVDNSTRETGFEVWRKDDGSPVWQKYADVGRNIKTFTDHDLDINKRYSYRVRSKNSYTYAYSAFTNDASATTAGIGAPENLDYSVISNSQIKLTWTDNAANETGYVVERKTGMDGAWSEIAILGPGTTSFYNSGLLSQTEYFYRIKAYNSIYSCTAYSEDIEVMIGDLPETPSYCNADALSSTEVRLTWKDKSDNELGFKIERRQAGSRIFKEIGVADSNVTSYLDRDLNPETKYYYRVRSYNKTGKSEYSREAYAVTRQNAAISDVPVSYWAQSSIQSMITRGVMTAKGGLFNPQGSMTRGDFAGYIVKAFDINGKAVGSFADVNPGTANYRGIMILKGLGVITGDSSNRYYPDRMLSRQDMAVIIARTMKALEKPLKGYDDSVLGKYSDREDISSYALSSMISLVGENIINDRSSSSKLIIAPKSNASRAEVAWALYNVLGKLY